MNNTYKLILFLFSTFSINKAFAQEFQYKAFTVIDGLPSNYIYRALEDNNGYLWIATDAGVARFDGQSFQIFTTDNGLPDNEVLSIFKETNGRIWVNCFKQKPAYFDETANRFINANENSLLNKIKEGTSEMSFFPIKKGGMIFVNEKGVSIIRDVKKQKEIEYVDQYKLPIQETSSGIRFEQGYEKLHDKSKLNQLRLYVYVNKKIVDSANLPHYFFGEKIARAVDEDILYFFMYDRQKLYKISQFQAFPLKYKIDSISIPETFNNYQFTPTNIALLSNSGKIFEYAKKSLELKNIFSGDFTSNSIYNDKNGNYWISTIDRGLLLYKRTHIKNIEFPKDFTSRFFMSVMKTNKKTLMAGNIYGQICEITSTKIKIYNTGFSGKIGRVRKLIEHNNQIYSFSEVGVFKNARIPLENERKSDYLYSKTAIGFNDSIIISGHTSSLYQINTKTNQTKSLDGLKKRITALVKKNSNEIYFGSTDGLYKYNYSENKTTPLNNKKNILNERITGICFSNDELGWIATGGSGVAVIKNDSVITVINNSKGIISNATKCITTGLPGQIWIGSSNGISRISYKYKEGKLKYSINNMSTQDGLSNNIINELLFKDDSIYAATSDGLSIVPANIVFRPINTPVLIQKISINQKDTSIYDTYQLGHQQRNIQLKLAGIDLTGHHHHLEYKLDNSQSWKSLNSNNLTLELNHGKHILQIRSVDINGYRSNQIKSLVFNIQYPLWKTFWFWLLVALILQIILILLNNKFQKKKRDNKIALEYANLQTAALEQQSFTSLMNPHFIFNALNSIQHYINLQDRKSANRYLTSFASLIRKNFEAVQQYFIPLEQEIENSKIYLRLEKMRFNEKIDFDITLDETIDTENIMVPTMMLQPLLENAILHGLVPSELPGKLHLFITQEDSILNIVIEDNGIGFKNSLANKKETHHFSSGIKLIQKRISALKNFTNQNLTIQFSPISDNEINPGNRTRISIPINLYENWTKNRPVNESTD